MMTFRRVSEYVASEPFRPFTIRMASGQAFEVRHPEMILIGKSSVRVYAPSNPDDELSAERWHDLSLLLMESIEPQDKRAGSTAG